MDEIGCNSVGKVPGSFPTELKKIVQRTQEQARLGPALAQPSLAQAGNRPKPARAWAQIRPDHMNPTHFSEICLPWFETETSFRIEIWMRQYRQIVRNFDPRLMELAMKAPDMIEKSKNDNVFQTYF